MRLLTDISSTRSSKFLGVFFSKRLVNTTSRVIPQQDSTNLQFVPSCTVTPAQENEILEQLRQFIDSSKRLFVLTGAGMSTESGIPDYRSEDVGLYAARNHKPMTHAEFMKSHANRQRYWARSYMGWPGFSSRQPSAGHHALAMLEAAGKIHWLVTQNVDALHSKAGSRNVIELHGSLHRIECQDCGSVTPRDELQQRLSEVNHYWQAQHSDVQVLPDGDVSLTGDSVRDFNIVSCTKCDGVLKPQVVFFGDNVKRTKVEFVFQKLDESDRVLVVGSSLQVYSAYRFAYKASKTGKPMAFLNIGPTRADDLAQLKLRARCGEILSKLIMYYV